MSKTFDQTILSAVKGISMSGSGCGPCAIASTVHNIDSNITPTKVAEYLYSIGVFSSAGTTRAGVTKALNHYGLQCLYFTPEHTGNAEWQTALDMLKLSHEHRVWAILLVVGKKNGGASDYWTTGGHFIQVSDYKDGKLYVRDSGARRRTGYHSPDELKGCVNAMWIIAPTY